MTEDNVLYHVDEERRAARITINREQSRNSLDTATFGAIQATLSMAERDPNVNSVVLTGAGGRAFASGADMRFIKDLSIAEYHRYLDANVETRRAIRNLSKPVIARVNGSATAGAMGLALTCDLVVAVSSARFGQTEINVGLLGGVMHLWSAGRALTSEMLFTGRLLSADEALAAGLINRVVSPDDLDPAVDEYCETLKEKSPVGLALTKRLMAGVLQATGYNTAMDLQELTVLRSFLSDDRREGMEAFLEHRHPKFSGN